MQVHLQLHKVYQNAAEVRHLLHVEALQLLNAGFRERPRHTEDGELFNNCHPNVHVHASIIVDW